MHKEESVLQIRTAEEFFQLLERNQGDLSSIGKYEVYKSIWLSTLAFKYGDKNIPYSIKLGEGIFYGDFSTFNAQILDLYFENARLVL